MGLLEKLGVVGDEPRVTCAECGSRQYASLTQIWVVNGHSVVICDECAPKMGRPA